MKSCIAARKSARVPKLAVKANTRHTRRMKHILMLVGAIFALAFPGPANADPAAIDAAARGVVRVVIIATAGKVAYHVSLGSGFPVYRTHLVTTAPVVDVKSVVRGESV